MDDVCIFESSSGHPLLFKTFGFLKRSLQEIQLHVKTNESYVLPLLQLYLQDIGLRNIYQLTPLDHLLVPSNGN